MKQLTFEDISILTTIIKKLDDDEAAALLSIIIQILERK